MAVIAYDVAGQGSTGQFTFQQVMAENAPCGQIGGGGAKGSGFINAFAHKAAAAKGILIQIGGLGVFLTKKLMDDVSYEYRGGQNILTLKKKLG